MSQENSATRRFFSGLTEYTFQSRLGVADPPLLDYLSELLTRCISSDFVFRVRNTKGRRITLLCDLLSEAEQRIGEAKREIHQHIGDFTLFWAGVYPETLGKDGEDLSHQFVSYCEQGKRSYAIASSIPAAEETPPEEVLERLSSQFEMCAYGLSEVRREWERREDGPDSLMLLN